MSIEKTELRMMSIKLVTQEKGNVIRLRFRTFSNKTFLRVARKLGALRLGNLSFEIG